MLPIIEVLTATIIWGLTGVFVKIIDANPVVISFFRLGVPAVFLLLYYTLRRNKDAFCFNYRLTLSSGLNGVGLLLYYAAFSLTSMSNVVIMFYTYPIWVILFSKFILKEKISKQYTFLLPIAFIGIIIIFYKKDFSLASKDFLGIALAVATAVIFAIMMIITKKEQRKSNNFKIIFHQNLIGALVLLPALFFIDFTITPTGIGVGVIYGFLIGLVGFTLYYMALKRIDMAVISILSYFEVVSAIFFMTVLLREPLRWNVIVGAILIILPELVIFLVKGHIMKSKNIS